MQRMRVVGCGRLAHWGAVIAYAGLIFYTSAQSRPPRSLETLVEVFGDAAVHAIEYGVLSVLCYRAFAYATGAWAATHAIGLAIVASTAYGITDEIHQAFVPLRDADPIDVVMDALGATIAALLWSRSVEPVTINN